MSTLGGEKRQLYYWHFEQHYCFNKSEGLTSPTYLQLRIYHFLFFLSQLKAKNVIYQLFSKIKLELNR